MTARSVLLGLFMLIAAAVPADPQTAAPDQYIVGPQDVLTITVFEEPQLGGKFSVDADGTFTYPLIGRVQAGGLSLRAIEDSLTKRLADGYLKKPEVSVEVEHYRSQSIFIVGEVRTPGKYPLSGRMTLIEALAQAGSTTGDASHEVLVVHPTSVNGEEGPVLPAQDANAEIVRVNIAELQSGKLSQNVVLRAGDTIFVPKAETFFVTGHVKTPGAYVYQQGMTVLQALSLAGGVSDRGTNRRIKIIRLVDGRKKELSVNVADPVLPGDTLIVPQRFF